MKILGCSLALKVTFWDSSYYADFFLVLSGMMYLVCALICSWKGAKCHPPLNLPSFFYYLFFFSRKSSTVFNTKTRKIMFPGRVVRA